MIAPYRGSVVIDLGTGDGRFISVSAARNAAKFYIGIDANVKPLEKPSMSATRKPVKGGLPNALFVLAAVEDLPIELDGVAREIHIHFPWGSLLSGVANGEGRFVTSLRRICADSARLTIVLGVDEIRDRSELARLRIAPFSDDHLHQMSLAYQAGGFTVAELKTGGDLLPEFRTSWARRLSAHRSRKMIYIVLKAR